MHLPVFGFESELRFRFGSQSRMFIELNAVRTIIMPRKWLLRFHEEAVFRGFFDITVGLRRRGGRDEQNADCYRRKRALEALLEKMRR